MSDLILYLGMALIGVVCGLFAKKKNISLGFTSKVQTFAITVLVFCMGLRMGANEEVTGNLGSIGVYALVFTIIVLVVTIASLFLVRKLAGFDKSGRHKSKKELAQGESVSGDEKGGVNRMTLIILGGVAIGLAIGYFIIQPRFDANFTFEAFNNGAGLAITIGLCILLFFVGVDIATAGTIVQDVKSAGARILLIPATIIISGLIAGVICALFLPISVKEGLCIAGGFAWYTLAPGIIMEAGMVTASAIAFMHNVLRELLSILLIPLIAEKIGYIETIAMPGAASMDVCLPIVERSTNSDVAVFSFVSGAIISFLVPVLVPILVSL
ncbi:MAG: lysine exporter LysO family protein [Clostridia bacterium]|nr:lysine exporter LysO family protein [Clostridia bacterium]